MVTYIQLLSKKIINEILKEIKSARNTDKYYDSQNNLRSSREAV